ncbi:hypothetical protein DFH27DRAFT_385706 [Peziza echinospora]|nr:hypothetical protein DFH27DRAFT_385706 [Peziza echinospora]
MVVRSLGRGGEENGRGCSAFFTCLQPPYARSVGYFGDRYHYLFSEIIKYMTRQHATQFTDIGIQYTLSALSPRIGAAAAHDSITVRRSLGTAATHDSITVRRSLLAFGTIAAEGRAHIMTPFYRLIMPRSSHEAVSNQCASEVPPLLDRQCAGNYEGWGRTSELAILFSTSAFQTSIRRGQSNRRLLLPGLRTMSGIREQAQSDTWK